MAIVVRFACGHTLDADPEKAVPTCPHCGEKRIASVRAPAPHFTGAVSGPHATTTPVEPGTVNLATDALKLKDIPEEEH